ncbi:hypothetical protein ACFE04_006227 [Oxalis oulophora]
MEKSQTKSSLNKLEKASSNSQTTMSWSPTSRGTAKNEVKERLSNKPKGNQKPPPAKENKKQKEFTLHTQDRAARRAMFNYTVATKYYVAEVYKKQIQKAIKMIEEEEIRSLRKEMVPRAQLMPYFDRPFLPQRSNRALTVPREPCFHMVNSTCWSCLSDQYDLSLFQHALPSFKPAVK